MPAAATADMRTDDMGLLQAAQKAQKEGRPKDQADITFGKAALTYLRLTLLCPDFSQAKVME
jgi:hypothetical protein